MSECDGIEFRVRWDVAMVALGATVVVLFICLVLGPCVAVEVAEFKAAHEAPADSNAEAPR